MIHDPTYQSIRCFSIQIYFSLLKTRSFRFSTIFLLVAQHLVVQHEHPFTSTDIFLQLYLKCLRHRPLRPECSHPLPLCQLLGGFSHFTRKNNATVNSLAVNCKISVNLYRFALISVIKKPRVELAGRKDLNFSKILHCAFLDCTCKCAVDVTVMKSCLSSHSVLEALRLLLSPPLPPKCGFKIGCHPGGVA